MAMLIGTTVYFLSANNVVHRGRVINIKQNTNTGNEECVIDDWTHGGHAVVERDAVFMKEYDVQAEQNIRNTNIITTYKNEIKDIRDLCQFAVDHAISGDQPDLFARTAFRLRAKELGVNLMF